METEKKVISLTEIKGQIDITEICSSFCPFLATGHDEITPMAFAHPGNLCYRHGTAVERQLQFQRFFCLSENYTDCLIYQEEERPSEPEPEIIVKKRNINRLRIIIPAIIVLILFAALVTWPFLN